MKADVSIKARTTPASLSFKSQATKHNAVKWSIENLSSNVHNRSFHVVDCTKTTATCTKMKNAKHAKLLFSMKKKWLLLAFLQRQSFVHVSN